jgi:hypothetical protein
MGVSSPGTGAGAVVALPCGHYELRDTLPSGLEAFRLVAKYAWIPG